jgi:hypothetical protein
MSLPDAFTLLTDLVGGCAIPEAPLIFSKMGGSQNYMYKDLQH